MLYSPSEIAQVQAAAQRLTQAAVMAGGASSEVARFRFKQQQRESDSARSLRFTPSFSTLVPAMVRPFDPAQLGQQAVIASKEPLKEALLAALHKPVSPSAA
jgi:hypothetical protein